MKTVNKSEFIRVLEHDATVWPPIIFDGYAYIKVDLELVRVKL